MKRLLAIAVLALCPLFGLAQGCVPRTPQITCTPNLSLFVPAIGSPYWAVYLNSDLSLLDTAVGAKQGALTLTTNGSSGASTLSGNVLNIPQYAGGSGTFNALTGDATSTATGGATTVKGINGTLLSGLATGLLKNTTSTGVPSIAVAGTDYVVPSVTTLSSLTTAAGGAFGTGAYATIANYLTIAAAASTYAPIFTLTTTGSSGAATYSGNVLNIPQYAGGGSMTWPATPGISVCTGTPCTAWGTSLTAPSGTIVGTSDTQTLTNKSIAGSEINSSLVGQNYGGTGVNNSATLTLGTSNQNWATLGTGVVKNTTTTGAISDAASSDVIALWTGTCSSSTYLNGAGVCTTPSGSGTVTASAQYDVAYYPTSGTVSTVQGAAISGFQFDSTSGTPAAATAAQLGTLANVAQYDVLLSAGTSSAIAGIAPSATSGLPLLSQGSSTNPTYAALALSALATQAANTVVMNNTGGSAAPTAVTDANANTALYETVATTLGDLVYGGASGTPSRLAGPTAGAGTYFVIDVPTTTAAVAETFSVAATGTGAPVLATSPTLVTPLLGTPTSGVITNLTGTCTSCVANSAGSATTATTATNLSGTTTNQIPYQSGSATTSYISAVNSAVLSTSSGGVPSESTTLPSGLSATNLTLVTPALGTPASGVITSLTGTCTSCVSNSATLDLPFAGGTLTGQLVTDGLGSDILVPAGGSITITNDGVHPNSLALPWQVTTNAPPTNATGWQGAVSASGTAGWFDLPSALPSAQAMMVFAASGSGHSVGTTVTTLPATMLPAVTTTVSSGSIAAVTTNNTYIICTTTCNVTPPQAAAGVQLCVRNAPGSATVITLNALGASNYYELTSHASWGTANHAVTSGGIATDSICLVGYDATHYAVMSYTGTWSD